MRATFVLIIGLIGCTPKTNSVLIEDDTIEVAEDMDADGYTSSEDCDDADAAINPNATEICDGIDNNCDGQVDENVTSTFYADADGDGFGDPNHPTEACTAPSSTVPNANDCNDEMSDVYPSATEICDGIDNNCDGAIDEGLLRLWYTDADADGYGSTDTPTENCQQPEGTSPINGDCDDDNPVINPASLEVCDGIDNNCDGLLDDGLLQSFYLDADNDGYGDANTIIEACSLPPGAATNGGDCDDIDPTINPSAIELCDGLDNDCDGIFDPPASIDAQQWFSDTDSDGYGDPNSSLTRCTAPSGYVGDDQDCDDSNPGINPVATEMCDGLDNNCDGLTDGLDSADITYWYPDSDGDGYGTLPPQLACTAPAGTVDNPDDCDDSLAAINPDGTETCNQLDDDCNGLIDDAVSNPPLWFLDSDGDGFGDPSNSTQGCSAPSANFVADDTDCDDADPAQNPLSPEVCNGEDDNCDGQIDENNPNASVWYADSDCDGFGDPGISQVSCAQPAGMVSNDDDCDDTTSTTNPDATEVCSPFFTVDDDCDGVIDNNCDTVIDIPTPSDAPIPSPAHTGACGNFAEFSTSLDSHSASNLPSYMNSIDSASGGYRIDLSYPALDYSCRCNSDRSASPGNYPSTTAWPVPASSTFAGARTRGYININCGESLERTIGLMANDAADLSIEGVTIMTVNWNDGQWKKFRHVRFPEPGLYAYEIRWSSNNNCGIDPMELVWAESLVPGYNSYDTMCAGASCAYGNGVAIPGFTVIAGQALVESSNGTQTSCQHCSNNSQCLGNTLCNSAGVCE